MRFWLNSDPKSGCATCVPQALSVPGNKILTKNISSPSLRNLLIAANGYRHPFVYAIVGHQFQFQPFTA